MMMQVKVGILFLAVAVVASTGSGNSEQGSIVMAGSGSGSGNGNGGFLCEYRFDISVEYGPDTIPNNALWGLYDKDGAGWTEAVAVRGTYPRSGDLVPFTVHNKTCLYPACRLTIQMLDQFSHLHPFNVKVTVLGAAALTYMYDTTFSVYSYILVNKPYEKNQCAAAAAVLV